MFCPVCGLDNPQGASTCTRCGTAFDRTASEGDVAPSSLGYDLGGSGPSRVPPKPTAPQVSSLPSPPPAVALVADADQRQVILAPDASGSIPLRLKAWLTMENILGGGLFLFGLFIWIQGYFMGYNYVTGILLIDETYEIRIFYLVVLLVLGYFLLLMSRRFVPASKIRGGVLTALGLLFILLSLSTSIYMLAIRFELVFYLYLIMLFAGYLAVLGMICLGEGVRELTTLAHRAKQAPVANRRRTWNPFKRTV